MSDLQHAIGVVINHEAAGAESGAGDAHFVEVERRVELFRKNARSGNAGEDGFQFAAGEEAAARFLDEIAKGDAKRKLVYARALDVARDGENHVAGSGGRTHGAKPVRALAHDVRDIAHRLAIVDE